MYYVSPGYKYKIRYTVIFFSDLGQMSLKEISLRSLNTMVTLS